MIIGCLISDARYLYGERAVCYYSVAS